MTTRHRIWGHLTFIVLCFGYSGLGQAQLRIEPYVDVDVTITNNADFGQTANQRNDRIIEVQPGLRLNYEAARLKFNGNIGLSSIQYLNNTQPDRTAPRIDFNGTLVAVPDWFYLDAGIKADRQIANPFGALTDASSTVNSYTVTRYYLTPRLEHQFSPYLKLRVDSRNTLTRVSDERFNNLVGGKFGQHRFLLERTPDRFGWAIEAERREARFDDQVGDDFTRDSGRLTLKYRVLDDLVFGLTSGYEQEKYGFVLGEEQGSTYGLGLWWQPGERTNLVLLAEQRPFGSSWSVDFAHRTPQWAWLLTASRDIQTFQQNLLSDDDNRDVTRLLDDVLRTRYPNDAEREALVRSIIADRGLPSEFAQGVNVYAQRAQLVTGWASSLLLFGKRDTYALALYRQRIEEIPNFGSILPLLNTDGTQQGLTLNYNRVLSPLFGFNALFGWAKTQGLGANINLQSKQKTWRFDLTRKLGPKTAAYVALRWQDFDSNVVTSGKEKAVLFGLKHRF